MGFSSSTSDPRIIDPYSGVSRQGAFQFGREFANPLSRGFGFGGGGQRFENRLERQTAAGDPFASWITNTRGILPNVQADAARAGQEIATRAPGAFQSYLDQVRNAQTGAETAGQFLNEASSPIQSQALYQQALRQATEASQQGAAGRGLLDAGSQQGNEDVIARDLATEFAGRQNADRQAALAGYGNAVGQAGQFTQGTMDLLPQLGQLLQAGSQLPFQSAQQLMEFFGGAQSPLMSLLQATIPQIANRAQSKGAQLK